MVAIVVFEWTLVSAEEERCVGCFSGGVALTLFSAQTYAFGFTLPLVPLWSVSVQSACFGVVSWVHRLGVEIIGDNRHCPDAERTVLCASHTRARDLPVPSIEAAAAEESRLNVSDPDHILAGKGWNLSFVTTFFSVSSTV